MILSLRPSHLKRYKDVVALFLKYGKADLLKGADLNLGEDCPLPTPGTVAKAEEFAADLEKMGPTFIKVGQLLSTRGDLLPPSFIQALSRLTDHVAPVPVEVILATIEEELKVKVSRVFPEFDLHPLATASLGQVHRATLRDGRQVVVKVQRPDIRPQITEDLEALAEIAAFLDQHTEVGRRYHLADILEEFRRTLFRELDYRQEARNLSTLSENLREFDRIVVPRPVEDLTTSRVLTMEYIPGRKISLLEPLARVELKGDELADQLFQAYLKQILVDGFVHADPHPGNVLLTDHGKLALIDLGMVVRLNSRNQERLVAILLAIGEAKSEEAADAVLQLDPHAEGIDRDAFVRRIGEILGKVKEAKLDELDMGRVLVDITRAAVDSGMDMPSEISMVGQTLLKLDSVGRRLAPEFKTAEAIRHHALKVMRGRVLKSESMGGVFSAMMEIKDFARHLPVRINRILDTVADNRLKVEVHALDEIRLMEGLQKIANRITLGLVLAALIIGAALTLRIDSTVRLFGYPALPMVLFLAAAGGVLLLIFSILFRDVQASPPGSARRGTPSDSRES
jgi:ubiquinone biosynthesis protein